MFEKRKEMRFKNGFIISAPSEGRNFYVKKEIVEILSNTEDDVIIVDCKGNLSKKEIEELGGREIDFYPSSGIDTYINPLDMDVWNSDCRYLEHMRSRQSCFIRSSISKIK